MTEPKAKPEQALLSYTPAQTKGILDQLTSPHQSIELWQLKGLDLRNMTQSSLCSTKNQAESSSRCGLALAGAVRKMTVLGENEAWPKKGCFVTKTAPSH